MVMRVIWLLLRVPGTFFFIPETSAEAAAAATAEASTAVCSVDFLFIGFGNFG